MSDSDQIPADEIPPVVYDADGDPVPAPEHIHRDFTEPEVEVYPHQTDFAEGADGTELDPEPEVDR